MTRAGRKRKQGRRHPSGKLVVHTTPAVNYRKLTAQQPHRRALPPDARLDEKAVSELGRLELQGCITRLQYDTGNRYASIVGAYRATIGTPRAVAGAGHGYECSCTREQSCYSCAERKRAYDGAYEALAASGRRALVAVNMVVINDEPTADIIELICGLNALSKQFGFVRALCNTS